MRLDALLQRARSTPTTKAPPPPSALSRPKPKPPTPAPAPAPATSEPAPAQVVLKHMPGADGDVVIPAPLPTVSSADIRQKNAPAKAPPPPDPGLKDGPCVVTRKDKVGMRCWGDGGWVGLDRAIVFDSWEKAEKARPSRSKVLTLDEAKASPALVLVTPSTAGVEETNRQVLDSLEPVAEPEPPPEPESAAVGEEEALPASPEEDVELPPVGSVVTFVIPSNSEHGSYIPETDPRRVTLDVQLQGVVYQHSKHRGWMRVRYIVALEGDDGVDTEIELTSNIPKSYLVEDAG